MSADKNIRSIQILRATAALLVVLYHFIDFAKPLVAFNLPSFAFGREGVDIFFLVSGFIIFVTTARNDDPITFAKRRLSRIIPLYWALTLLTFGIMALAPKYLNWGEANSVTLLKSLFFFPYRGAQFIQPILFVGWTLNYEMFFYTLWMFALALFTSSPLARIGGVAGVILFLIACGYLLKPQSGVGQFYTNPIMFEFIAGAGIGFIYMHGKRYFIAIPRLGSAFLIFVGILFMLSSPSEGRVTFAISAFVIVWAAISLECSARVPNNFILEKLGDSSYAIYLAHPLLLTVLIGFLKPEAPFGFSAFVLIGILTSIAICAVGIAIFTFFEIPVNQYLRRRFINSSQSAGSISKSATI